MSSDPTTARSRLLGYVGVAAAASLWGTFSLFFRPAEAASGGKLAPATEAFLVFFVVFLTTAPWAFRDACRRGKRPMSAWTALGFTGIADALNALFFFWAMQLTSVSIAVLSHYLAPVLIAVAAPFVLGEHMKRATSIALVLALCGLGLLLEPWQAGSGSSTSAMFAGTALGAGSAIFYAANVLVFKRIQHHFSPVEVLAWHMVPALLVLYVCVPEGGFALEPPVLALLAAAGLIPGALAGVLFLRGLARVPASRASVLTLLEPLVAVFVGAFVWHETPGILGVVGAGLVLSGAWLVLRSETPEGMLTIRPTTGNVADSGTRAE